MGAEHRIGEGGEGMHRANTVVAREIGYGPRARQMHNSGASGGDLGGDRGDGVIRYGHDDNIDRSTLLIVARIGEIIAAAPRRMGDPSHLFERVLHRTTGAAEPYDAELPGWGGRIRHSQKGEAVLELSPVDTRG